MVEICKTWESKVRKKYLEWIEEQGEENKQIIRVCGLQIRLFLLMLFHNGIRLDIVRDKLFEKMVVAYKRNSNYRIK